MRKKSKPVETPKPAEPVDEMEKARNLIRLDRIARETAARDEIAVILKKYGVQLNAQVVIQSE